MSKPKSREEALNILKKMSGKSHFLISSVCISKKGNMIWNYTDKAELVMKNLNDSELKNYLSKISDKNLYAYNVYQIEGEGKKLFSEINGDKNTIMGLPITKIKKVIYRSINEKIFCNWKPYKSLSFPELHNFWIKKNKINAVYDKIKLEES